MVGRFRRAGGVKDHEKQLKRAKRQIKFFATCDVLGLGVSVTGVIAGDWKLIVSALIFSIASRLEVLSARHRISSLALLLLIGR